MRVKSVNILAMMLADYEAQKLRDFVVTTSTEDERKKKKRIKPSLEEYRQKRKEHAHKKVKRKMANTSRRKNRG